MTFRAPVRLAAVVLLAACVVPAARAEATPDPVNAPVQSVVDGVTARWTEWKAAFARGDVPGAAEAARDLTGYLREEGVGRLGPMAQAAVLEGRRAMGAGRHASAIDAFRLARELDPQSASAAWGEAVARFRAHAGAGTAIGAAAQAARLRFGSFWPLYGDIVRLLALAFFALLIAAAAGIAVLLVVHGPVIAHDVEESLPTGWHPAWRRAVGWALVLSPAAVQWLGVFGLVPWAVALAPAANRRERALIGAFLLLLALAVPVGGALWVLAGVTSSPTARVAVASAERALHPDLLSELGALAEAQPRDPKWKVLQARLIGSRRPEQALRLLREAAEAAPADARVRVALGNVFYRSGKKETAAVHYRDALRLAPDDVVALFNLHRVRTTTFEVRESEDLLGRARAADPVRFDDLQRRMSGEDVADPEYGVREIAGQVLADEAVPGVRRAFSSGNPLTMTALAAVIAGSALTWRVHGYRSRRCGRCGRAYCPRCGAEGRAPDMCSACHQLFSRREGLAPAARQAQARRIDGRLRWLAAGRAIAQALWPGLGLVHEGRTFAGFAQAALWAFLLLGALGPETLLPGSAVVPLWRPGSGFALAAAGFWLVAQTPALRPSAGTRRAGR